MNRITKCRTCDNANLISVLNLGIQSLTGVFPKSKSQPVSQGPLELIWCGECQLLQLAHSFDVTEMYGDNYGYRSGLNPSMVNHLQTKVRNLEKRVDLKHDDAVIDIGSNDATLLKAYQTVGLNRIGIDPTGLKFESFYVDKEITLIPEFFPSPRVAQEVGSSPVKIITSIAMFYDLHDPIAFVKAIADLLHTDGIWHFEQSYMPSMIRMNSYDTIVHEHVMFYSLHSLEYILDCGGMRVVDVQMNGVNGGSFAVTAVPFNSPMLPNEPVIEWLLDQENRMLFDTPVPFRAFEERVYAHRKALKELIAALNDNGKTVLGYGASTKGNALLQFCGFTKKDIPFIADVNPEKYGAFTPGSMIPIESSEVVATMMPDYYLVLPWHFKDGIIRREQTFLENGGKLIFPFPEIEIVGG